MDQGLKSLLDAQGIQADIVDASYTVSSVTIHLENLQRQDAFTNLNIKSIKANLSLASLVSGLHRESYVDIEDVSLSVLLSHREAYNTHQQLQEPSYIKGKLTSLGASLGSIIGVQFAKNLRFTLRNFVLRLESSQNGRSFAATISVGLANLHQQNSQFIASFEKFSVDWETDPIHYATLLDESNIQEEGDTSRPCDSVVPPVNFAIEVNTSLNSFQWNMLTELAINLPQNVVNDLSSLSEGVGSIPQAWGLDRSGRALWRRAFDTMKRRRQVQQQKQARAFLKQLHQYRKDYPDFDEFVKHSESFLRGEVLETTTKKVNKATPSSNLTFDLTFSVPVKVSVGSNRELCFEVETAPIRYARNVLEIPQMLFQVSRELSLGCKNVQVEFNNDNGGGTHVDIGSIEWGKLLKIETVRYQVNSHQIQASISKIMFFQDLQVLQDLFNLVDSCKKSLKQSSALGLSLPNKTQTKPSTALELKINDCFAYPAASIAIRGLGFNGLAVTMNTSNQSTTVSLSVNHVGEEKLTNKDASGPPQLQLQANQNAEDGGVIQLDVLRAEYQFAANVELVNVVGNYASTSLRSPSPPLQPTSSNLCSVIFGFLLGMCSCGCIKKA